MQYKLRHLQERVRRLAQHSKVILIVGARQVGKSTLLTHLLPDARLIMFDRTSQDHAAAADPELFLSSQPRPLILDEIQYVPQLFSAIKQVVDRSDEMGQYFLTGSHSFRLLKEASESLAGRIGIIDLEHMTFLEAGECFTFADGLQTPPSWLDVYLKNPAGLVDQFSGTLYSVKPMEAIWRGGFPGFIDLPEDVFHDRLESYVRSYLDRDAIYADPSAARPEFRKFLKVMAVLTAQEVNYAHFGRELGVSRTLIDKWAYILKQTYQWREIPPLLNNTMKRLTKSGKGYLTDSGLACHLLGINDPLTLLNYAHMGALFETYCVNMVHGMLSGLRARPEIYHWRTLAGAEVDLVLEMNGKLYPIEIKAGTRISKHDARSIGALRETYGEMVQHGVILYAGALCYKLTPDITVLPFNALMKA